MSQTYGTPVSQATAVVANVTLSRRKTVDVVLAFSAQAGNSDTWNVHSPRVLMASTSMRMQATFMTMPALTCE